MLDYILRNQSLFWGVLGLVALIPILGDLIVNRNIIGKCVVVASISKRKEVEAESRIKFRKWIYLLALIFAVLCVTFVALQPIPKTTALEFPTPVRQTAGNHHLIVFVHGWRGDPTESWMQFPNLVSKDKRFDSCHISRLVIRHIFHVEV